MADQNEKTSFETGIFVPILVPDFDETDENFNERSRNRWERFRLLPEAIQEKVSGDRTADAISKMAESFDLERSQIIAVSRAIRRYYFGEITASGILAVIAQETGLAPDICEKIHRSILAEIINENGTGKEPERKMSKMAIVEALRKFPEIGEQRITSDQIELKSFPYPVRPSIKNWISDYTFNVGLKNKDSLIRNGYLFRNPNTAKLSDHDRARLLEILKSFDEGIAVSVDENRKLIVFSDQLPKPNPVPMASRPKTAPVPQVQLRDHQAVSAPAKKQDDFLNERLGAWRKEAGTKPETGKTPPIRTEKDPVESRPKPIGHEYDSRMTFSSPQRLPIEKNIPTIQEKKVFSRIEAAPVRKAISEPVDLSKIKPVPATGLPAARNVVDLREE